MLQVQKVLAEDVVAVAVVAMASRLEIEAHLAVLVISQVFWALSIDRLTEENDGDMGWGLRMTEIWKKGSDNVGL